MRVCLAFCTLNSFSPLLLLKIWCCCVHKWGSEMSWLWNGTKSAVFIEALCTNVSNGVGSRYSRRWLCFAVLCILSWFGTCIQALLPEDRYKRTRTADLVWQIHYRVDDWEIGGQFQAGEEMFLSSIQTGSCTHPHPSTVGTGGYFHGNKMAGLWRWPFTSI
jgi:hypothetical protein